MDVGAGFYMYDAVVKKFTFAISSPDEFLYMSSENSVAGKTARQRSFCVMQWCVHLTRKL